MSSEKMMSRKMERLRRGRVIDLSRHHWIPRLILSTLILLTDSKVELVCTW